jgi:steroid 5-alpha reductase family enzyme
MLGSVIAAAAIAVAAMMIATWLASVVLRDVSIVDPVWGFTFVVVAVVAALVGAGEGSRRVLVAVLVGVWGLRLGIHLSARKLGEIGNEDRRYAKMRKRQGSRFPLWSLVMIFGLQGLLVLVVSLPVTAAARCTDPLDAWVAIGIAVWAVGVSFETVGDEQLRRFKADTENRGQVMNRGLWRYTRHPNYFGDACVWWGIWLVALPAGGTWWTFVGPLVMTILLVGVSGAALLEKDIDERRPGYREYIERTSGFIPRPPKRG